MDCYLKDGHEVLELGSMRLMNIHQGLSCTHQMILLFLQIKEDAVISSPLNLCSLQKNCYKCTPHLFLHCSTNFISFVISDFFLIYFLNLYAKQHVSSYKKLEMHLWKWWCFLGNLQQNEIDQVSEKRDSFVIQLQNAYV